MKITKLEHACLDITDGDGHLIIDPGAYTTSLTNFNNITALVITHVHQDHFDEQKVGQILAANPAVQVFSTSEVAEKLANKAVTVPEVGKIYTAGGFTLEFFGGQHAMITATYPKNQNFGVLVNDTLYYPGDSFTPCPKPHTILAAPSMAPWLKLSEAADFITADSAQKVFPTHNGFLNEAGNDLHNRMLGDAAKAANKTYLPLKPNELINT